MLRSVFTVGGWTMASRILGFARDMLIASRLGAGPVADAFFIALKLPNLFRRLFGEGAFNAAFVPAFAGSFALDGPAKARALANSLAGLMTIWLSALVLLGIVFMPQLLFVLAPGFVGEAVRFPLAVELTRITFPYLLFICLAALVSGVLNGMDRFGAAAATPVLFNLVAMAALLGLTPYVATPGHALAWGVLASGVLQLGLLLVAVRAAGLAISPLSRPVLTPEVRGVLRRMGPGLVGAGVTQLNLAIDIILASLLPAGAVSYLYYADRVAQLPLGVIGAAVGTALLPLLARQLRTGRRLAAHRSQNRAIELSLAFALPAAFAIAISAGPIITTLFERGQFDAAAAAATAGALVAGAIGLPAFVLVKALTPGFFARGDTATPVKVGILVVVLNLALNLALIPVLAHVGIALATSIAAWINVAILGALLVRRRQFRADRRLRRTVPRLLAAAVLMALLLWGLGALLFPVAGTLPRFAALAALILAGLVTYFGTAQLLGGLDLREALRMLRRRSG
ncbi:murein biosynthesis integral membrane protein MurJ [Falsiroseomonas selenitidurans]|uniref:Probable lipid II flippase MurJ n=1 Tax=Falsiroseomonas selenitidurans TaxID=2716335 RepID=A0ABX1E611_9PROT|nr:murein biosynthesis integral membrane protein MurJ [Falsiroseomonas selenitidurans]NKC32433.1 murein biosynthesis integral membrane protein MurJ [Falsiroseomonas selenitidurans]